MLMLGNEANGNSYEVTDSGYMKTIEATSFTKLVSAADSLLDKLSAQTEIIQAVSFGSDRVTADLIPNSTPIQYVGSNFGISVNKVQQLSSQMTIETQTQHSTHLVSLPADSQFLAYETLIVKSFAIETNNHTSSQTTEFVSGSLQIQVSTPA